MPRERDDYLPFGEEIGAQWGRTGGQKFAATTMRQGFTGYEKDGETGLDYAQARYFSRRLGRFTSADPLLSSGVTVEPQTWTRYSYTVNNPLKHTDPSGLDYRMKVSKVKGKEVMTYIWDRNYTYKTGDEFKDIGVPSGYGYVDIEGQAIRLWGDNSKDPRKVEDHGYQIVKAGRPGDYGVSEEIQGKFEPPPSFLSLENIQDVLDTAEYVKISDPFHDGVQYASPESPTLHIIINQKYVCIPGAPITDTESACLGRYRTSVEYHRDDYTQGGTWTDLAKHMIEAINKARGKTK